MDSYTGIFENFIQPVARYRGVTDAKHVFADMAIEYESNCGESLGLQSINDRMVATNEAADQRFLTAADNYFKQLTSISTVRDVSTLAPGFRTFLADEMQCPDGSPAKMRATLFNSYSALAGELRKGLGEANKEWQRSYAERRMRWREGAYGSTMSPWSRVKAFEGLDETFGEPIRARLEITLAYEKALRGLEKDIARSDARRLEHFDFFAKLMQYMPWTGASLFVGWYGASSAIEKRKPNAALNFPREVQNQILSFLRRTYQTDVPPSDNLFDRNGRIYERISLVLDRIMALAEKMLSEGKSEDEIERAMMETLEIKVLQTANLFLDDESIAGDKVRRLLDLTEITFEPERSLGRKPRETVIKEWRKFGRDFSKPELVESLIADKTFDKFHGGSGGTSGTPSSAPPDQAPPATPASSAGSSAKASGIGGYSDSGETSNSSFDVFASSADLHVTLQCATHDTYGMYDPLLGAQTAWFGAVDFSSSFASLHGGVN